VAKEQKRAGLHELLEGVLGVQRLVDPIEESGLVEVQRQPLDQDDLEPEGNPRDEQ
jgi:hypothetical protein